MAEFNRNSGTEVTFEIQEHIGVLTTHETGWTKEVNMVSWNGNKAKIDIRDWNPEHTQMGRGITLTKAEGDRLVRFLGQRIMEQQRAEKNKDSFER